MLCKTQRHGQYRACLCHTVSLKTHQRKTNNKTFNFSSQI
jgi:hypothetical protein